MSWSQIAQYPVALPWDSFYQSDSELKAAVEGTLIYTFASTGVADSTVPYQFYAYNPSANTWTAKAVPDAEDGVQARATDFLLVGGGGHVYRVGGAYQSGTMVYTENRFLDYNVSTNAWTAKAKPGATVPGGSNPFGACYANGKVWILTSEYNATLAITEYFLSSWDPATNIWTSRVTDLPIHTYVGDVQMGVLAAEGNNIYIILGADDDPNSYGLNRWPLYKYDTVAGVWTQVLSSIYASYSGVLTQPSLVPDWTGTAYSSEYFQGFTKLSATKFLAHQSFPGQYAVGSVGVDISVARPQIGGPDILQPFTDYIASQGLIFAESNGSGNRQHHGQVGYGGSLYLIAPRSLSSDISKADQRSFKWTPDSAMSAAPTGLVPATGATVNSDVPTLSATLLGSTDKKGVEWEIASDAAFTLNKRTIFDYTYVPPSWSGTGTYRVSDLSAAGGVFSTDIVAGSQPELYQGTWYVRARTFSGPSYSPWTTTSTVTVSHPPALSPTSPVNDVTLDFGASGAVTFQWTFNDTSPTDVQTAYQIIVERNSDGVVLLDTGKISSQTARSYAWNLPAAEKDGIIRWKIRGWDSDDVVGAYSNYALFRMSDKPVVAITSPAEAEAVTTGRPIVNWTFTASAGRTQASYRVRFYYNGTTLVHDSGTIAGTELTYQPAEQVLDVGSYTVQVDVVDNRGLPGTDSNSFTTSYDAPDSPVFNVNSQLYADNGFIEITWGSANQDYAFSSYAVYRRSAAVGGEWTKLSEDSNVQGAYTFRDYTAASGIEYEYVVTQKAYRFSVVAESSKAVPGPQLGTGVSPYYVLVHPTDDTLSIILRNVKSDSFTDEHESAELNLINRGRHVDHGSRWGYKGSLSAQIRYTPDGTTPREQRLRLELIKATKVPIYLRNPFGDVWKVDVGNIQIERVAGVGTEEFVDVTIPYSEVS